MVFLVVKGTRNPDEFMYECNVETKIKDLAPTLAKLQNLRHRVRLQMMSVNELATVAEKKKKDSAAQYKWMYDQTQILLRDPKQVCTLEQFERIWETTVTMTKELFPKECIHKDGDNAAVDELYRLHEDPDLDEDYRLVVYHCRAIMDPEYRVHEVLKLESVTMWFCAKEMESENTIGKYCGNNNKSKVTVKLNDKGDVAPSKEPRMAYNDQREMRKVIERRKEEYSTLEESELRDRVVKQSRGAVALPGSNPIPSSNTGGGGSSISTSGIRHIYPQKSETVVQGGE